MIRNKRISTHPGLILLKEYLETYGAHANQLANTSRIITVERCRALTVLYSMYLESAGEIKILDGYPGYAGTDTQYDQIPNS